MIDTLASDKADRQLLDFQCILLKLYEGVATISDFEVIFTGFSKDFDKVDQRFLL